MKLDRLQHNFVAMIRHGDTAPFSGIEPRRLKIYQNLFFNNIENLLANGFPVVRKILGPGLWRETVQEFWSGYRCQTPYFPRLGLEFVSWLQSQQPAVLRHYPFLVELAHYEYMEVAVDLAEEELPPVQIVKHPESCFRLNPAAVILHYHYPVHRIRADYLPKAADGSTTHLAVYRRRNEQVGFIELSPATAHVLEQLQAGPMSLAGIAAVLSLPVEQVQSLEVVLQQLYDQEVLV